MSTLVIVNDNV